MSAERELLEQAWLGHLRGELAQRGQFKAELLAEWQCRRAQLLDDLCKARVRGDLTMYRALRWRWGGITRWFPLRASRRRSPDQNRPANR
jgi:hypothetical protein